MISPKTASPDKNAQKHDNCLAREWALQDTETMTSSEQARTGQVKIEQSEISPKTGHNMQKHYKPRAVKSRSKAPDCPAKGS